MLPKVFTKKKIKSLFLVETKGTALKQTNKTKQTENQCTNNYHARTVHYCITNFFMVKSIYIFVCLTISPIGCD